MDKDGCHECVHVITLLNQEFDKLQTQYKDLKDKYKDLEDKYKKLLKLKIDDKKYNSEIIEFKDYNYYRVSLF